MPLFRHENRQRSERSKRIYALFEIVYTCVDFLAAAAFLVGSFLFFSEDTQTAATWLFVVGSACFALKPTLRLVREIKLYSIGDEDDLAKRLQD
ncbi:MAG: YrhK family protein [Maritimibacter harenae]|jgi:hypothetical protein|uniref:YrhK domain-containing protein n=1 Tax=Maritimibacter harenae TaxID=2606218 RepID=A0A845LZT1_9RHOB|nr:YrhK family protein [Maritimibacter harenae]MZR13550.1 hypothetical protein [Maritimibacter harenae]